MGVLNEGSPIGVYEAGGGDVKMDFNERILIRGP